MVYGYYEVGNGWAVAGSLGFMATITLEKIRQLAVVTVVSLNLTFWAFG